MEDDGFSVDKDSPPSTGQGEIVEIGTPRHLFIVMEFCNQL
jgi:hypothetical protein